MSVTGVSAPTQFSLLVSIFLLSSHFPAFIYGLLFPHLTAYASNRSFSTQVNLHSLYAPTVYLSNSFPSITPLPALLNPFSLYILACRTLSEHDLLPRPENNLINVQQVFKQEKRNKKHVEWKNIVLKLCLYHMQTAHVATVHMEHKALQCPLR